MDKKKTTITISVIGIILVIIIIVVLVVRSCGNTSGKLTSTDPVLTAGTAAGSSAESSDAETAQNSDPTTITDDGEVIVGVETGNSTSADSTSETSGADEIIEDVPGTDTSDTEPVITDQDDGVIELPFVPADEI